MAKARSTRSKRIFKVAIIGAGGRSNSYAKPYVEHDEIEIVALVDPNADHRAATMKRSGIPAKVAQYDDWRDMMAKHKDLDGVVISSPNQCHAEPAIACFERGLPIALEKPLEANKERCESIIEAEREHNGRSLIGFVLRSTPFYAKIHELLHSGAIGHVISIQADELVGYTVSSIMFRSPWRRKQALGGGALLEKCCHDMDILNWMTGQRPVSVHSFGSRQIFRGNPELPEKCEECAVGKTCHYYKAPQRGSQEDKGEDVLHKFVREDNRCIYNIDKDTIDNQSVTIEYEGGTLANFMLTFNTSGPQSGRNFHAVGLKGRIWGNLSDKKVYHYDNASGEVAVFDGSGDGSGHGGGDRIHSMKLFEMMKNPEFRPEQNAEAGYLSAVVCFAAETSRLENRRVSLAYVEDGMIDIL